MTGSVVRQRVPRIICTLIVLLMTCASPLLARIQQMELDDKPVRLMEAFRIREPSFPDALATDKDVFIVVYASAAEADFYVLARPSVDPVDLAHKLESAIEGTPLASEPVMYMKRDDYTWANAYVNRSRLWSREAEMRHPIGPIVSKLSKGGLRPHIILCMLSTAELSHKLNIYGYHGRRWRSAKVPSNRTDLDFSLRSSLSTNDMAQAVLVLLAIPVLGTVAFPILIHIAKAKRTTTEGRRALLRTWYFWFMMLCMGFGTAFAPAILRSSWRYKVDDLWFAEGAGAPTFVVPLLLAPWLLIGISRIVARLVFRGPVPEASKSFSHNGVGRFVLFFVPIFALITITDRLIPVLPETSPLVRWQTVVVGSALVVLGLICERTVRLLAILRGQITPDNTLLERLSGIAFRLGVDLKQVNLVDAKARTGHDTGAIYRRDGTLLLRRELAERLSQDELDFVAAHALAHAAHQHRAKATALLLCTVLLTLWPGIAFVTRPLNLTPLNWQLWALAAGLALLILDAVWLNRKSEEQADLTALEITGNPQAAAGAVLKTSGLDNADEAKPNWEGSIDTLAVRRLRWLEKSAKRMGLDAGSAFGTVSQDDALTARAQEIASRMEVRLMKADIVEPAAGKPLLNAAATRGNAVLIGRALIDTFTPDELDFVLAHELAHLKMRHVTKLIAAFVLSLAGMAASCLFLTTRRTTTIDFSALATVAVALVFVGNVTWMSRRREVAADRMALRTTRNLPAAISALGKLAAGNPVVIPEELEDCLTHPKERYRIQSLRNEAKKLGLDDESKQRQL